MLGSRCSVVLEKKKKSTALGNDNRTAEIKYALCCSRRDELQHNRLVKWRTSWAAWNRNKIQSPELLVFSIASELGVFFLEKHSLNLVKFR